MPTLTVTTHTPADIAADSVVVASIEGGTGPSWPQGMVCRRPRPCTWRRCSPTSTPGLGR